MYVSTIFLGCFVLYRSKTFNILLFRKNYIEKDDSPNNIRNNIGTFIP